MNIIITCRGYSVTDSIRQHVESSIRNDVGKYLQNRIEDLQARVVLSKEAHLFNSCISIYEKQNEFVRSTKSASTIYKAIDAAISHIVSKLRKYKNENIDRFRKGRSQKNDAKCKGYALDSENVDTSEIEDSPLIIEEDIPLKRMSVSDAVMEMELLSVPALLFINGRTGKVNMVYYRDNTIVWVDPLNTKPV